MSRACHCTVVVNGVEIVGLYIIEMDVFLNSKPRETGCNVHLSHRISTLFLDAAFGLTQTQMETILYDWIHTQVHTLFITRLILSFKRFS